MARDALTGKIKIMPEVYLLCSDRLQPEEEALVQEHMPKRRERAKAFRRETDRRKCLAGGLLALRHIPGFREENLIFLPHGKPALAQKGAPEFNLSHSGNMVVLAVDQTPVGIDVERMSKERLSVAERIFSPEEIRWMERTGPSTGFFVLWTMKESVLKYLGTGFRRDPRNICLSPFPVQEGFTAYFEKCRIRTVFFGEYMISCAAETLWDGHFEEE